MPIATLQSGATSSKTLHVTRLEPTLGAEVTGIDLRQPLTPALRDELHSLLLEYKVIFFRDQIISTEHQIAFAREFGEIFIHPTSRRNDPTQPQAHLIEKQDERKSKIPRASGCWHTDTSWLLQPALGSVLRTVDLPPAGGDTLWADTGAVYRALPNALHDEIDNLSVVHDFKKPLDKIGYNYPILAHPLVRTHPETGEDGVFINFSLNPSIVGWTPERSQQLIDRLLLEFNKPEHQVRFKWREHSVAFWDNRSTLHYATYNYGDYPRKMERVLIAYHDIPHRVRRSSPS